MDEQDVQCPSCGASVSTAEAANGECPRCGAALERPAQAIGEAVPRDSVLGLRVSLWGNGLQRLCLAPYAAVRGWSERYALWARLLACVGPFCVGWVVSFSLYVLLPSGQSYRWALGVLAATIVVGVPMAVVFFPGSTAPGARRLLQRLKAEAQELRDEMVRALVWEARQRMLAARDAKEAADLLKAEAQAPPIELVKVRREESQGPRFGLARFLAVAFQIIAWAQIALAVAFLIAGLFGAQALLSLPLLVGLAWSGMLVLALGLVLKQSADTRRNLWRLTHMLEQIRQEMAAPGEGEEEV
jgi:hypothetical protein